MESELKRYYSAVQLTDEQKATLIAGAETAAHQSRTVAPRRQIFSVYRAAACLVLLIGTAGAIAASKGFEGNYGVQPDTASISLPSVTSPSGERTSFYYCDSHYDAIPDNTSSSAGEEILFELDGRTYFLSGRKSSGISFVFDSGEKYTLRQVMERGIISPEILASGGYLVCMVRDNKTGETSLLNSAAADLLRERGGNVRIENGKLIK